jgi:hypothetical protein
MIALLISACIANPPEGPDSPPAESPPAADSDAQPDTPVDTPIDPPTPTLAGLTVRIEPPAPRFDEDLRCVVDGNPPEGTLAVAWLREAVPVSVASTATSLPGDTLPHRLQAGLQTWACSLQLLGADGAVLDAVTSSAVVIEPPVPMVHVRAGNRFYFPWLNFADNTAVLTRDYGFALDELSEGLFYRLGGTDGPGVRNGRGPEYSAALDWHAQASFVNNLSELDGVEPCYPCANGVCGDNPDPYGCEGYRLPNAAEWIYAAREEGGHRGMLPQGQNFNPNTFSDCPDEPYIINGQQGAYSDQIWWRCNSGMGDSMPVGVKSPNLLGIRDMLGNGFEFTQEYGFVNPYTSSTDPVSEPLDLTYRLLVSSSSGTNPWTIDDFYRGPNGHHALRIVRTLLPPAPVTP